MDADALDPEFVRLVDQVRNEIRETEKRLAEKLDEAIDNVEKRLTQSFAEVQGDIVRAVQAQLDEVLAYLRDHDATHVSQSGSSTRRSRRELRPAGGDGLAARREENGDEESDEPDSS